MLVDREDPEVRNADERQGQRRRHRSGGPRKFNLGNAFWWVVALIGPVVGVTIAFGISALLIAIAVCVVVAVGYLALERGNFDGEKIMGGLLG